MADIAEKTLAQLQKANIIGQRAASSPRERFFNKNRSEATRIMLHVHRRGVGVCGVYTYEVAETKVTQVMDFARQHQHPLQCTLEKD